MEDDGRTAIYDITARVVYLPGGRRLEAHSGLGDFMDNPRHVHLRMRGATPPNVYNLTLREQLFHGVRAIRLNPVDRSRMYGRDGILAHTYMLGANGQSNGCVSFSNYPEFLNAYLRGEVTRLAVVERLESPPGRLAAGQLPELRQEPVEGDRWQSPVCRRRRSLTFRASARESAPAGACPGYCATTTPSAFLPMRSIAFCAKPDAFMSATKALAYSTTAAGAPFG